MKWKMKVMQDKRKKVKQLILISIPWMFKVNKIYKVNQRGFEKKK